MCYICGKDNIKTNWRNIKKGAANLYLNQLLALIKHEALSFSNLPKMDSAHCLQIPIGPALPFLHKRFRDGE